MKDILQFIQKHEILGSINYCAGLFISRLYALIPCSIKRNISYSCLKFSRISLEAGFYFSVCGSLAFVMDFILKHKSAGLLNEWIPGLIPLVPSYNHAFINYILLIVFIFLGIALLWFFREFPQAFAYLRVPLRHACAPLIIFAIDIIGVCFTSELSFFMFFMGILSICLCESKNSYRISISYLIQFITRPVLPIVFIIMSLTFYYGSWYPVVIPNDYHEIQDVVTKVTSKSEAGYYPRYLFINCFNKSLNRALGVINFNDFSNPGIIQSPYENSWENHNCPVLTMPLIGKVYQSLSKTGAWQDQTGRLLYHHSYYFIPSIHFLTYGLQESIPYL